MEGKAVERMESKVVDLAAELVSIPSYEREEELARFLARRLRAIGFEVSLEEVEPGRPNLIAHLPGKGKTLMFCGHMDTVPPDSPDQLRPRVEGGRLYGRGACDMKGALAAMVCALEALTREGPAGPLLFLATVGEETGFLGMRRFMARHRDRIAGCIVGEPTSLEVGIAHKGGAWIELTTIGRPAHGSTPERGVNAVYYMALLVRAIQEELAAALRERPHPLLGPGTVNVGLIRGGTRPNVVPARCTIQVDRRLLPGETPEGATEELRALVGNLKREHPELAVEMRLVQSYPPLEVGTDEPVVRAVIGACRAVRGKEPELVGLSYGTDGALSRAGGIPTVICGPGSATQAHTEGESVDVAELVAATHIYVEAASRFLEG